MDSSYLLSSEQIRRKLEALPPVPANWTLILGGSASSSSSPPSAPEVHDTASSYLTRTFVARDFKEAIASIQSMGDIAEELGHHPDFHLTQYRTVQVVMYTHKLRGVTELDVELARLFNERVTIDYSPKWLRENPVRT
jgi:pterin-4a-carbinolamine dehydratase